MKFNKNLIYLLLLTMNIELTEFTFDYKLNKILQSNINPIIYSDISNNMYYCKLYYYFEYLFEFFDICQLRKQILLYKYQNHSLDLYLNDMLSPFLDPHSYNKFIICAKKYNTIKLFIYNNESIYNPILSKLLKKLY